MDRGGNGVARAAIRLLEVDVANPPSDADLQTPTERRDHRFARVLVRRHGRVLGQVDVSMPEGVLTAERLHDAIAAQLPAAINAEDAVADDRAFLTERGRLLAEAPPASVILCTRGRPQQLPSCLRSLMLQQYPRFELIVVDNGEPRDEVEDLLGDVTAQVRRESPDVSTTVTSRVVKEPHPGLSRARNTGLREAQGLVVAFTDDDAEPDPHWLAELWRALATVPGAGCATGLVLPAALDTPAQLLFEEFGGHSKGRTFHRTVIDPLDPKAQNPLYPLPAFGAGVSMAFHREILDEIGGFDPALGAGAPAGGSEDTAVFTQVLLHGYALVYTPDAVVRHHHRPDVPALRAQLAGYGRGLTAYYTKLLIENPRLFSELLKLTPVAMHDLLAANSLRNQSFGADFPQELAHAEVRGMLQGPLAYLKGRRAA